MKTERADIKTSFLSTIACKVCIIETRRGPRIRQNIAKTIFLDEMEDLRFTDLNSRRATLASESLG